MRIQPEDRIYVVIDPTPQSELADIFFAGSLHDLELQFRGGLTHEKRPTIFTDREEAEQEALGRLLAFRAARSILRANVPEKLEAQSLRLVDGQGNVVLDVRITSGRAGRD